MLNLPPLCPATDARLEPRLAEQIRLFGAAGFPLAWFRGGSLGIEAQWEELKRALEASWRNGGWPTVCIHGAPELAVQAVREGWSPWGLHLGEAASAAIHTAASGLAPLHVGTSAREAMEASPGTPVFDHASLALPWVPAGAAPDAFRRTCALLRARGIVPIAVGEPTMAEAEECYQAGCESLVLGGALALAPASSGWLWEAQRLRWRSRPPCRQGAGVALIGGSGSGKSTLARELGERLGLPVHDLDDIVARRACKPIPQIFSEDGEPAFRALEEDATCEAFRSPAVLALGGGAWESDAIRAVARASGFTLLWIAEDPERIWRRVARDPGRPLAQEREAFFERWRIRTPRWMEAQTVLPLGRDMAQVVRTLSENATP